MRSARRARQAFPASISAAAPPPDTPSPQAPGQRRGGQLRRYGVGAIGVVAGSCLALTLSQASAFGAPVIRDSASNASPSSSSSSAAATAGVSTKVTEDHIAAAKALSTKDTKPAFTPKAANKTVTGGAPSGTWAPVAASASATQTKNTTKNPATTLLAQDSNGVAAPAAAPGAGITGLRD